MLSADMKRLWSVQRIPRGHVVQQEVRAPAPAGVALALGWTLQRVCIFPDDDTAAPGEASEAAEVRVRVSAETDCDQVPAVTNLAPSLSPAAQLLKAGNSV